jgi:hypothetical protein
MTNGERRRFVALAKRLEKDSLRYGKRASRMYKHAGQSHLKGGTGDEGWHEVIRLDGMSDALGCAALQIRELLKALPILLLFLSSIGCSAEKSKPTFQLEFNGKASVFSQTQANAFNGLASIENSLLNVGGEIKALHDPFINGTLYVSDLGSNGIGFTGLEAVLSDTRFTHVIEHAGAYYNFGLIGKDVYLWKSSDLKAWRKINGGQPVLTHEDGTIYENLWNVGVAVDGAGTWHLLAETAPHGVGQAGLGLAYMTAAMNSESISFDATKTGTHAIPFGGNPYLKHVPGKGILALYGMSFHSSGFESLQNYWYVSAGTLQAGGVWVDHSDKFAIGVAAIAVCDPHLVELSDGSLLGTVSVNQDSISIFKTGSTATELFDSLVN